MRSGKERRLLRRRQHPHARRAPATRHKVNFCKFTNETRLAIEDASENSGQTLPRRGQRRLRRRRLRAGAGLRRDHAGRRPPQHRRRCRRCRCSACCPAPAASRASPTSGKVRRDRADVFCTAEEGVRGKRAVEWRLVDEVGAAAPPGSSRCASARAGVRRALRTGRRRAGHRADAAATARSTDDDVAYPPCRTSRSTAPARVATLTIRGPARSAGRPRRHLHAAGAAFWPLRVARELDDAILHLRLNEPELGLLVLRTEGDRRRRARRRRAAGGARATTGWCARSGSI